ncbi:MAG: hypothetical protein AB7V46_25265 [Thermomicrobiales bacterium]
MAPEDREMVTRSIANLWVWQTAFTSRIMQVLKDGGMSPAILERMLQELDEDTDMLDGPDDQAYAIELLAVARSQAFPGNEQEPDPEGH